MLHTKSFFKISPLVPEKIFKGFYHIWTWWPSWSCDQHHVNKFPSPYTQKLTYKIWLKMAQWFLRKASFNFQKMTLTLDTDIPS